MFRPSYCLYTLWLLPKSKVDDCESDSCECVVDRTDIRQTCVTFTKFQYKYSHFVRKHCIRKVVGIAFDQFGIKVPINKKIILHTANWALSYFQSFTVNVTCLSTKMLSHSQHWTDIFKFTFKSSTINLNFMTYLTRTSNDTLFNRSNKYTHKRLYFLICRVEIC